MKEITMYQTTDGQQFSEEEVAKAHQEGLANLIRVEKFLDANYPKAGEGNRQGASRTMAKKAVQQFLDGGF